MKTSLVCLAVYFSLVASAPGPPVRVAPALDRFGNLGGGSLRAGRATYLGGRRVGRGRADVEVAERGCPVYEDLETEESQQLDRGDYPSYQVCSFLLPTSSSV